MDMAMVNCLEKIFKVRRGTKSGFGIMEVMVSIVVLGFLYMALNSLQVSNHEGFIRVRDRDGATEVAEQVMNYLKSVGLSAIPSKSEESVVIPGDGTVLSGVKAIERSWDRSLGGTTVVQYVPTVTVMPTKDYESDNSTSFDANVKHVYAKQVNVKVEWKFKGGTQSINVSGVIK